mmetsp:Transcript_11700/g.11751  ORF Transcript_11700/g.11751 Transcript_11700/m.11751 type:complete len:83 (-) Transcript_11700:244-492(-)
MRELWHTGSPLAKLFEEEYMSQMWSRSKGTCVLGQNRVPVQTENTIQQEPDVPRCRSASCAAARCWRGWNSHAVTANYAVAK